MTRRDIVVLITLAAIPLAGGADAAEIHLPDIQTAAFDQPELYAIIKDGSDILPFGPAEYTFEVFVDTGASGFVISKVIVDWFGIGPAHFIGEFTETGIAGEETGDVTLPWTIKVLNGSLTGADPDPPESAFIDFGEFSLWTRRYSDFFDEFDPISIIGMPIISQRVMVMDPTPLEELDRMKTFLLPHGDPNIPDAQLNAHVAIELRQFVPDEPPPGEVFPATSDNPVIPGVIVVDDQLGSTGEWLLDTGAAGSFISIAQANAIGLSDGVTLDDVLDDAEFLTEVGGIGGTAFVPGFVVDEVRVPTTEGFDLVFQNVEIMVLDVAGLDGVFGMNFLVPSLSLHRDIDGPGYFERIVIDTANRVMGLDIFDDAFILIQDEGDFDDDNDVDLDDLSTLVAAMTGPLPTAIPGTGGPTDLDGDGDTDLADVAVFADIFTGSP